MKVILFESNINRNEWNHVTTILLLDSYFKIYDWIYKGILRVLVKKIIKSGSNSFSPISFPPIELLNNGMNFPFPLLKLSNNEIKEYYKIINFIHLHSIPTINKLMNCIVY